MPDLVKCSTLTPPPPTGPSLLASRSSISVEALSSVMITCVVSMGWLWYVCDCAINGAFFFFYSSHPPVVIEDLPSDQVPGLISHARKRFSTCRCDPEDNP